MNVLMDKFIYVYPGAKIVLACRNLDEGKAAIEEIQKSPPPK